MGQSHQYLSTSSSTTNLLFSVLMCEILSGLHSLGGRIVQELRLRLRAALSRPHGPQFSGLSTESHYRFTPGTLISSYEVFEVLAEARCLEEISEMSRPLQEEGNHISNTTLPGC